MRTPKFFRRFRSSPKEVSKSQGSKKPNPRLTQPFKAPKPLSEMLLIQRWRGYNKGDLLTILRHWPLRQAPSHTIQRQPLFSPLFWRSFVPLRRFLLSRYPGRLGEGDYAALSLSFAAPTSPLLDMVWEEGLEVTPTTYKEYSFPPSSKAETPLQGRGPVSSSPAPGRRGVKLPLTKRIPLLLHRLVKGKISPQPAGDQPLGKKEGILQEGRVSSSTETKRGISPRLQAKLSPRGLMGLKRIRRRVKGPSELDKDKGFSQTQQMPTVSTPTIFPAGVESGEQKVGRQSQIPRQGTSKAPSQGEMVISRPRPSGREPPETPREGPISPARSPSSPESIVSQEEFQEKSPKPFLEGYLSTSVFRTSLWAKRILARFYPKSHLVRRTKAKPVPRKEGGVVHHPARVESPKGDREEMIRGREVPFSPPSGEEPTRVEKQMLEVIEPSAKGEGVPPRFEGREEAVAPGRVSVPPPIVPKRPSLVARVLVRLHPRYRKARESSIKGKPIEAYQAPKSVELGEEIHHIGDELVWPEPTRPPLGGEILSRVQRKREISQKAELDKLSATFEPSLLGESQSSARLTEGVSPLPPVEGPVFQATQAAFKALAQGPGIPLDMGVKQKFESFFGMGLEEVRVHSGAAAAEVTGGLGAAAVTMGSHIFLSPAISQAYTRENIGLLAHELTHVVQGKSIKALGSPVSGKSKGGQPPRYSSEAEALFYPMSAKVEAQKGKIPPLMAASLQRATPAPSTSAVTAQIAGVSSSIPEEEGPKENFEEMALLVYERIKRRLENEGERLPG